MVVQRIVRVMTMSLALAAPTASALAQVSAPPGSPPPMVMSGPLGISAARDGSGTSWLPDDTVTLGTTRMRGPWMLMLHGHAFVQEIATTGDRGHHEFGSVNWVMGMAEHPLWGGPLTLRTMLSAEPLTVGRCGYPDLLQTGEACRGAVLHDQQHPHDLFMEVAADYRHALTTALAVELYGGPSGEPALGPTAFPHRPSAMADPTAPIAHHWLDSTHVSFGVVTAGLYGRRWKTEASAFNGREPDDKRYGFDLAPLDSYAGRVWWLPSARWAMQLSAGHLHDVAVGATGVPESATRVTASVTYHRVRTGPGSSATTIAWGQNREAGGTTQALLAETTVDLTAANQVFARGELMQKSAADLALGPTLAGIFPIAKLQVGYTRLLPKRGGVRPGLGGSVGIGFLPASLGETYGTRHPLEFSLFLALRPSGRAK